MTNTDIRGPSGAKLPDVILLNGASSAGKSSLTLALQARLPFVRMGIDDFVWERAPLSWYGAPEGFIRVPGKLSEYGEEALKLWRTYHRAVRVCVAEGLGVVVDDAILTREPDRTLCQRSQGHGLAAQAVARRATGAFWRSSGGNN